MERDCGRDLLGGIDDGISSIRNSMDEHSSRSSRRGVFHAFRMVLVGIPASSGYQSQV